jgi:hypothetical protein
VEFLGGRGDTEVADLYARLNIIQQEVLGESVIANNIAATLGLSLFIPFGF